WFVRVMIDAVSKTLRRWIAPARPEWAVPMVEPRQRRALLLELVLVFSITLGLSGLRSLLSLLAAVFRAEPLAEQRAVLRAPQATLGLIDLTKQVLGAVQLVGWGGLGLYLLWRGGLRLAQLGLSKNTPVSDIFRGAGLAA